VLAPHLQKRKDLQMNSSVDSKRFELYCERNLLLPSRENRGLWLAGRQSYADDAVEMLARQLLSCAEEVQKINLSNVDIAERKLAEGRQLAASYLLKY
jgi:hypothetical protein